MTFFLTTDTIKTTLKIMVLKQKARERGRQNKKFEKINFRKVFGDKMFLDIVETKVL
jgi:hypothetical protein